MVSLAVDSTALQAVDYYHGFLKITFESGETYRYYGVPKVVYDGLISADSKGRYFHDYIRDQYRYERVR